MIANVENVCISMQRKMKFGSEVPCFKPIIRWKMPTKALITSLMQLTEKKKDALFCNSLFSFYNLEILLTLGAKEIFLHYLFF